MANFHGLASLNDRQYEVDVRGSPGHRIVIVVNGKSVFDKTPFLAKSRVDFQIEGRPATLEWRAVGLLHGECYFKLGTREFLLQERDSAGQLKPPMDAEQKQRLQTIGIGVGSILFALFNLVMNYLILRGEGRYYPKLLILSPILLVFGTALLLTRPGWKGDLPRFMQGREKLFGVLGALLMVGVGSLFKGWFVATFRK